MTGLGAVLRAAALGTACAVSAVSAGGEGDFARAEMHYTIYCQGCHLPDGRGESGFVPRLAGTMGSFLTVEGGRSYLARVPGATSSPLTDAELAEVYNWLLLSVAGESLPADYTPYSAEEIGAFRRDPLLEITPARAALVRAMKARSLPVDDTY